MSIFHPFVYPEYRTPILEGSEHEEEEEEMAKVVFDMMDINYYSIVTLKDFEN